MNYDDLIQSLEIERKKIVKNTFISMGITVVIVVLGFILFKENGLIFGMILGLILSFIIIVNVYSKYKKAFKGQLMPLIIAKTGMNLTYEYNAGISEGSVMDSKLFKRPDRYHSEDLMHGEIEGVHFMSSDVHMEERHVTTDGKGHRQVSYVTFFLGRWFIYEFNKEFNGIIQVREGMFSTHPWGLHVQKITLEDVEFNKKFKTYATNEHDAFYVLTPTLLVNMKTLERRFSGKIYFSFIGSQLHIGIYNSKNNFEAPVFKPITDQYVTEMVQDIIILKDIVNELKLNTNIFKK